MAGQRVELRTREVGRSALLVELLGDDTAMTATLALVDLAERLRRRLHAVYGLGIDVVAGARTVLVDASARSNGVPSGLREAVESTLSSSQPGPATFGEREPIEVPVRYDGPDLAAVASAWGIATDEVADAHCAQAHVVAFCGFVPGFAYLRGDGDLPEVPRLSTPRVRVAPGSVGLAGPFTGVYPGASPGGWQIIGHTNARLWDLHAEPPALLSPGRRVRFVAVPAEAPR